MTSLSELYGKKVIDLEGYVSNEFGDSAFKLTRCVFEDGSTFDIEGEHDFPFIVDNGKLQLTEDMLDD